MSIKICPKCNNKSLVKSPTGKVMQYRLSTQIHIADEHKMICLFDGCGYKSNTIRINTKMGAKLAKPWWKRIFS